MVIVSQPISGICFLFMVSFYFTFCLVLLSANKLAVICLALGLGVVERE